MIIKSRLVKKILLTLLIFTAKQGYASNIQAFKEAVIRFKIEQHPGNRSNLARVLIMIYLKPNACNRIERLPESDALEDILLMFSHNQTEYMGRIDFFDDLVREL